jgi:hypothetical protein
MMDGTCGKAGEIIYKIWASKLGGLLRRWEDSIKIDLREIGIEGVDWTELAVENFAKRADDFLG